MESIYDINFTKTSALGNPATSPLKATKGMLNVYLLGSYFLFRYFLSVSTVPNCNATCGPTPSKVISIPL